MQVKVPIALIHIDPRQANREHKGWSLCEKLRRVVFFLEENC
jgi:hypothetical protein